jgi:hypothetical protein
MIYDITYDQYIQSTAGQSSAGFVKVTVVMFNILAEKAIQGALSALTLLLGLPIIILFMGAANFL